MKQYLRVEQEYIDNGYMKDHADFDGPPHASATCPIAQALHYQGEYDWDGIEVNNYVVNIDEEAYSVSNAVSTWIVNFDDWKWGRSNVPPIPVTLTMDTDTHHITLKRGIRTQS